MAEISGLEKRVHRIGAGILALVLGTSQAWGAHITEFSPQGSVATIESISLAFDQPVTAFGDIRQAAPVDVVCDDPSVKGEGRWLDARRWTYVFTGALGPGVSCTAAVPASFRTVSNEALGGKTRFSFQTPGPRVTGHRPYGSQIDEDQVFVVEFNGVVDPQSVVDHSVCLVEGVGEAVPVRLVTGQDRRDVLAAAYYSDDAALDTASRQLLQCKRRLPAGAKMQLKIGPGVATPQVQGRKAVAAADAVSFDFTVREPFKATLACMRENANAACTPVSAMTLSFSAPISTADARKVSLLLPSEEIAAPLDGEETDQGWVSQLRFDGPFPELSTIRFDLPAGLKDDAGRSLSNADQFPLAIQTAAFPPLAKFSSSSFGVIERFAYVSKDGTEAESPPLVPLTLRNVEAGLLARDVSVSAGALRDLAVKDDRDVLAWFSRLRRLQDGSWTAKQLESIMGDRTIVADDKAARVDVRGVSVLNGRTDTHTVQLPGVNVEDPRPFEVIGIPIRRPGFHVLEVESARLGQALLENAKPMYVRTSVLVTNLAVHVKTGRDDILAWVTTLDEGKVVPDADINVLDCAGNAVARGRTDGRGVWHYLKAVPATDYCDDTGLGGVYVSARIGPEHVLARGEADFSFAFSDWNAGIESWRFNVPTDSSAQPTLATHTVFDRSLYRAGEVVSMKHFMRVQTRDGFELAPASEPTPDRLVIEHQGSDQRYEQKVDWRKTPSGGLSALSRFDVPKTARLGVYTMRLTDAGGGWYGGGAEFRVEEFKLPLLAGTLQVGAAAKGPVVAPTRLDADVQVSYVSGGPAGRLPVSLSAALRARDPVFAGYEDYSFAPPQRQQGEHGRGNDTAAVEPLLFLDKKAMTLDAAGGGRFSIDTVPVIERPGQLVFELEYPDPNGQIQTLTQIVPAWPAQLQAGIRAGSWFQAGTPNRISGLALTLDGKPAPDAPIVISAVSRKTLSTRKRMVGGFYSYDNQVVTRDIGEVCKGRTSARGEFTCVLEVEEAGSVELIAELKDSQARLSRAATTVWVTGKADLWFGGENDDRIDVIPSRKTWMRGEVAEFQVRMPFRYATALVAVEREGVLHTEVVNLQGRDPTIRLPVQDHWGPNVYVSVLALRGRVRELPWHSFLEWGWKEPKTWYGQFTEAAGTFASPTPFVDLAKPAFRFGLASINVSDQANELIVAVQSDKSEYQVRDKAKITLSVSLPDGTPAAHASVVFAAVDEALLELAPNQSWDLLSAMRQTRSYGVDTATAQMQVVGRRHFGRKALPAGGGGGKSPTRELLDTLLMWAPAIETDADGRATLELPLNDSITRFRLVAVADHGRSRFGMGHTDIAARQDLQVISGLPALVREGDQYQAAVTVRNSTARDMMVQVSATYKAVGVPNGSPESQVVSLAAGSAESISWALRAPDVDSPDGLTTLDWTLAAEEQATTTPGVESVTPASDRVAIKQRLIPAVPVRAQQATLMALDAGKPAISIPVAPPRGALSGVNGIPRGGLEVHVLSSLAGGLPGVRDWFEQYPYTCLEQTASRSIGLQDGSMWNVLMQRLPDYLDEDGLVAYFPGGRQGNEVLTAYLLSTSHEAQSLGQPFAIPEALRQRMTHGLQEFVQGNISRSRWAPQRDLDLRKLAALEALSRYKLVRPRMLDSIEIAPDRWPSSAVIDWMSILQRVPGMPQQKSGLQTARKILRARMLESGTGLMFAGDRQEEPWWLMASPESAMAKLMLVAVDRSEWQADMPLIAQGLLNMQRQGAWRTTTANLLGSLAIEKFSRRFEPEAVSGRVLIGLATRKESRTFEWEPHAGKEAQSFRLFEPWTQSATDALQLAQRGSGQPWVIARSMAAVPVNKPVAAGYALTRELQVVSQAVPGAWTKGDVYRVRLQIRARTPTVWAVITDPIPAGASILGGGLGRDSGLAVSSEHTGVTFSHPSFVERGFESYRAYYDYLPAGTTTLEYTVRLNTVGQFQLPATRAEAMYQPDVFGELPNMGGLAVAAEHDAP